MAYKVNYLECSEGGNVRWTVSHTSRKFSPRTFPKGTCGTGDPGARENLRTGSLDILNNSNKSKQCTE